MKKDECSYANVDFAKIVHSDYDLDVDFEKQVIRGIAKLKVHMLQEADQIVLDQRSLDIKDVDLLQSDGQIQKANVEFGQSNEVLGQEMKIKLPQIAQKGDEVSLQIKYSSMSGGNSIQWLSSKQTAGGEHPYLFTQNQAINARSFVPCQDTPAVKMSYSARVRVPGQLVALMSAKKKEKVDKDNFPFAEVEGKQYSYHEFEQNVPIPSYLLALAVGDLVSRQLGDNSRVWAEPAVVDAAASEFQDTIKYLQAGIDVAGEYVWGQYDLLMLPPSFPYGGMENPCLTFVTPTLIAGDRSLTNVIAHEIAHSWTGNLVTNATWEDFWLNEGFTVFLERKIIQRVLGDDMFFMQASEGYQSLLSTIQDFGEDHPYTRLVPDLSNETDPDKAFSKVPYEKGFHLLYQLQSLVGGAEVFEPFLRSYLQKFKFQTVTSAAFIEYLTDYFKDVEEIKNLDWNEILYAPGKPKFEHEYQSSLNEKPRELAVKWHTSDVLGMGKTLPESVSMQDIDGWSSWQVIAFLAKLRELRSMKALHSNTTRQMAQIYGLDKIKNSEVRLIWYLLCIKSEDEAIQPLVEGFLREQGRMKFLRPLYKALYRSVFGKDFAVGLFQEIKETYHPIAQKMLAIDLDLADE